MTGLLLLDVDGPLNPYAARPHRRPAGYETFRRTARGGWFGGRDARRYRGIRVWLRPEHGPWLLGLAERTGLELVWATTWEHEANEHIGPSIGLPRLPVIEFPDRDPVHGWSPESGWKWRAVLDHAAGRPLAWLDDEHDDPFHGARRAEFDRGRQGIPTLLCHVDPRHGLGPEHLDRVPRGRVVRGRGERRVGLGCGVFVAGRCCTSLARRALLGCWTSGELEPRGSVRNYQTTDDDIRPLVAEVLALAEGEG